MPWVEQRVRADIVFIQALPRSASMAQTLIRCIFCLSKLQFVERFNLRYSQLRRVVRVAPGGEVGGLCQKKSTNITTLRHRNGSPKKLRTGYRLSASELRRPSGIPRPGLGHGRSSSAACCGLALGGWSGASGSKQVLERPARSWTGRPPQTQDLVEIKLGTPLPREQRRSLSAIRGHRGPKVFVR
jgi:hypothetical protein